MTKKTNKTDSSVVQGGPEGSTIGPKEDVDSDTAEKETDKTEYAELVIGGQTFKVPKEAAQAIKTQRQTFDSEISELKTQVIRSTQAQPIPASAVPAKEDELDYSVELFANPKGTVDYIKKQMLNEVKELLQKEVGGLKKGYQEDQAAMAFWADFYGKHPELRAHEWVVKATLQQNADTFSSLQGPALGGRLAELTQENILGLTRSFAKGTSSQKNSTQDTLESGGTSPDKGEASSSVRPVQPQSLSAGIREKRKAKALMRKTGT